MLTWSWQTRNKSSLCLYLHSSFGMCFIISYDPNGATQEWKKDAQDNENVTCFACLTWRLVWSSRRNGESISCHWGAATTIPLVSTQRDLWHVKSMPVSDIMEHNILTGQWGSEKEGRMQSCQNFTIRTSWDELVWRLANIFWQWSLIHLTFIILCCFITVCHETMTSTLGTCMDFKTCLARCYGAFFL